MTKTRLTCCDTLLTYIHFGLAIFFLAGVGMMLDMKRLYGDPISGDFQKPYEATVLAFVLVLAVGKLLCAWLSLLWVCCLKRGEPENLEEPLFCCRENKDSESAKPSTAKPSTGKDASQNFCCLCLFGSNKCWECCQCLVNSCRSIEKDAKNHERKRSQFTNLTTYFMGTERYIRHVVDSLLLLLSFIFVGMRYVKTVNPLEFGTENPLVIDSTSTGVVPGSNSTGVFFGSNSTGVVQSTEYNELYLFLIVVPICTRSLDIFYDIISLWPDVQGCCRRVYQYKGIDNQAEDDSEYTDANVVGFVGILQLICLLTAFAAMIFNVINIEEPKYKGFGWVHPTTRLTDSPFGWVSQNLEYPQYTEYSGYFDKFKSQNLMTPPENFPCNVIDQKSISVHENLYPDDDELDSNGLSKRIQKIQQKLNDISQYNWNLTEYTKDDALTPIEIIECKCSALFGRSLFIHDDTKGGICAHSLLVEYAIIVLGVSIVIMAFVIGVKCKLKQHTEIPPRFVHLWYKILMKTTLAPVIALMGLYFGMQASNVNLFQTTALSISKKPLFLLFAVLFLVPADIITGLEDWESVSVRIQDRFRSGLHGNRKIFFDWHVFLLAIVAIFSFILCTYLQWKSPHSIPDIKTMQLNISESNCNTTSPPICYNGLIYPERTADQSLIVCDYYFGKVSILFIGYINVIISFLVIVVSTVSFNDCTTCISNKYIDRNSGYVSESYRIATQCLFSLLFVLLLIFSAATLPGDTALNRCILPIDHLGSNSTILAYLIMLFAVLFRICNIILSTWGVRRNLNDGKQIHDLLQMPPNRMNVEADWNGLFLDYIWFHVVQNSNNEEYNKRKLNKQIPQCSPRGILIILIHGASCGVITWIATKDTLFYGLLVSVFVLLWVHWVCIATSLILKRAVLPSIIRDIIASWVLGVLAYHFGLYGGTHYNSDGFAKISDKVQVNIADFKFVLLFVLYFVYDMLGFEYV